MQFSHPNQPSPIEYRTITREWPWTLSLKLITRKPEKVYPGHQREGRRQHYLIVWFVLTGPLSSELAMWTSQVQIVATFARTVHPHTIPDNVNIYFSQSFYFGVNSLVSPTTCTIQFQSQAAQALAVFGNNPHKLGHNSLKQYPLDCGASIQISLENLQEMMRYHNPAVTAPW